MWNTAREGNPGTSLSSLERVKEFLRRVSSTTDISLSDVDQWNYVLTIDESLNGYAVEDVVSLCRPLIVEMLKNNTENSLNMLVWLGRLLEGSSSVTSYGLSNYVYIQRIWLGMLFEEEEASNLLKKMQEGNESGKSSLVDQLTDALLQAMLCLVDQGEPSVFHSLLLLEIMKLIVTVCTSRDEISGAFLESFMKNKNMNVCARSLLNFWVLHQGCDVPKSYMFDDLKSDGQYAITAIAKSMLSLPWQAATMLRSRSSTNEPPVVVDDDPFATVCSLVILVFYFHGTVEDSNPFKTSMDALVNEDVLSDEETSPSKVSTSLSFPKLVGTMGKRMACSESASLLLYILLQGNRNVVDYLMARTDIDVVVVPILELLMNMKDKKMNHVYILMIILLILSQDSSFAHNANGLILKDITLYKKRPMHNIRLDSLMVMVLLQVALYNIHSAKDMYLHTNTLATLANIAPTLSDMFPATCQRILHVLEKLDERLQAFNGGNETHEKEQTLEVQLLSDFLSIVLEVLNAIVVNNLTSNPTLVYCMLQKKDCIERLQNNVQYRDMASNISIVVHFFGDQVEKEISTNQHGLTAERVQDTIVLAMRQWNGDMLQISTDLKFSYEEEASNADFFVPYVKSVAFSSSSLIHSLGN